MEISWPEYPTEACQACDYVAPCKWEMTCMYLLAFINRYSLLDSNRLGEARHEAPTVQNSLA